jgi:gliding motility-associated-like protein
LIKTFSPYRQLFYIFTLCLFFHAAQAQLGNFTFGVTATNETCTANGSLTFGVANTTPGATMLYTVYHLPDTTTPIATLSNNTITGLVAGFYHVVATQSLNNQSASQWQDVAIADLIIDLEYVVNGIPEICGNDAQLFAVPISGTPVAYEIIAGPVIRPLQWSNTFLDLPAGDYTVRVFDNCGEGLVHTYTLGTQSAGVYVDFIEDLTNCASITVSGFVLSTASHVIKYPITIETTVTQPSGPPLVFSSTIGNGSSSNASFSFIIPFTPGDSYLAHTVVTDGCGNIYVNDIPILVPDLILSPQMILPMDGCNNFQLVVSVLNEVSPVTVDFLAAPPGFNPNLYNPAHPGPFNTTDSAIYYYNPSIPLPEGTYTVQVTDSCGRTAEQTVTVEYANEGGAASSAQAPGCTLGIGSLAVSTANGITGAQLLSAPAGYPNALPFNLSDYIITNTILMNNLPAGEYQISTIDACNFSGLVTVTVIGYESGATSSTIIPHCDSFDFLINHTDNLPSKTLWLQKYYPVAAAWGHPETGSAGAQVNSNTAMLVQNNIMTMGIQSSGTFRVVKQFSIFGSDVPCQEVIHTFDYNVGPRIIRVYTIGCENNTYNSIVEATGFGPLIYRITMKDGEPFFIDNVNSAIFTGLQPGVYNFQVEDSCGNILNSLFDVSNPLLFAVQPLNLCPGQAGALTVPFFPLVTYQWWKEGAPDDILSTTNSLPFAPFNATADIGLYHVRITFPAQQSCVNLVLDFTVSPTLANPQAGNDATTTYCGPQGAIDLFSLLTGTFDNFGEWQEMTVSGTLNGNIWNSDVPPGNYQFRYRVEGLCEAADESVVSITMLTAVQIPEASATQPVCQSDTLMLSASSVDGASYNWTGPNGFSSAEQNPAIENIALIQSGEYTVSATLNGCTSDASFVNVSVLPLPEFTLSGECVEGAFVLSAVPIANAFDVAEVEYAWNGPNNFSATGNPIVITGLLAGNYALTVTSPNGCDYTSAIEIPATLCGIPKGVSPNDDGDNDNWDLSGLDIRHVKIFNRYGMLMFEKAHYVNEWHGQDKHGCELPSATYYYLVELTNGEARSGWVYLMRN